MKNLFNIIFIVMLLPTFILSASAEDIYTDAAKEFGAGMLDEGLTAEEKSICGEFNAHGNYDVGNALAKLWRGFIAKLSIEIRANVQYCVSLAVLALLCSLGTAMCANKDISDFLEISVCAVASLQIMGGVGGIVNETLEAMYRLSDYSKAALPVVFTAAAAGGAVSSAATKFAAVSFALDVLMSISQKLIIPTVNAFLAMIIANSMFPNAILNAVQKVCKWICGTLMTAMTLAFTAYINMIGAIGAAVDSSAVKTARTFISGALPVVGGMISDASAMLLSAAGVIKNCAGVYGLIAVSVMCAGPFALLSVKMLLYKGVAATADSLQISRLSALYNGMSNAMGLLLGLLGSCGIMLFISLTAGMKAVSI